MDRFPRLSNPSSLMEQQIRSAAQRSVSTRALHATPPTAIALPWPQAETRFADWKLENFMTPLSQAAQTTSSKPTIFSTTRATEYAYWAETIRSVETAQPRETFSTPPETATI